MIQGTVRIGTAGWSLPRDQRDAFGPGGSILERYATRLNAVEINSSFYRPHRAATYERWAASVPNDFRFAVKMPRTITHERRLGDVEEPLDRFLAEVQGLGTKLGLLLLQLPPSLVLDGAVAKRFFAALRARFAGAVVCEPRHASWFTPQGTALLERARVARAAVDPAPVAAAAQSGGDPGIAYFRWHGSPRIYYSDYDDARLAALAAQLREAGAQVWCIFDNTARGAATKNARTLQALMA